MPPTSTDTSPSRRPSPLCAVTAVLSALTVTFMVLLSRGLDSAAYLLTERGAANLADDRARGLVTDDRELGNVITDNLGMIVFGIVAIVALGALISGLGSKVVTYVTKQLGV